MIRSSACQPWQPDLPGHAGDRGDLLSYTTPWDTIAGRARRKLRGLFEKARRAAKGQVRLGRDDEYQLLRCAYAMVRCWEREGVGQEIERELRAEAQVRETLAAPVVTQRSRDGSAPSRR